MKRSLACCGVVFVLSSILPFAVRAQSSVAVLTGQYNNSRTGANLNETTLAPSNVSAGTFGLLFTQPVDGNIYAQPLYVPGLTINGTAHNVVFVATLNNSVFAFDADTAQPSLWHVSLGPTATVPVPAAVKIGILSTPVIDLNSGTLFVVTLTGEGGALVYRLHALNFLTGVEVTNIVVQGAVAGTGGDSQTTPCISWNGGSVPPPCIPFKPVEQLQRPALLEDTNATIYLAFGTLSGAEASVPYHGWLFGYQYAAGAFTQTLIFNSTPSSTQKKPACSGFNPPSNQCGHGGGIWMSGRGPALDTTGVYVVTGNGGFGGAASGNWGESALRLSSAGVVADSFTPSTYPTLNAEDLDLGDAGVMLFSSANATVPNLALAAGKTGTVYVMNCASLGGLTANNASAVQTFTATSSGCGTGPGQQRCYEIHSPALWNRPGVGSMLYVWGYGDALRVWDFNDTTNQFQLDANQGTIAVPNYPGGGLAVSANGNSGGIVWAIVPTSGSTPAQGALYAFDATNVSTPLWMSTDYWFATKFTIPTIANGKVYVPTSNSPPLTSPKYQPLLRVYGLCATCAQASPFQTGPQLRAAKH